MCEKTERIKAYCTESLSGRHIGSHDPGRFESYCSIFHNVKNLVTLMVDLVSNQCYNRIHRAA